MANFAELFFDAPIRIGHNEQIDFIPSAIIRLINEELLIMRIHVSHPVLLEDQRCNLDV